MYNMAGGFDGMEVIAHYHTQQPTKRLSKCDGS